MHLQVPGWLANIRVDFHFSDNKLMLFLVMIGAIIILSFLINSILMSSIGGIYRVFVAPGVIVHEFSHAFGCIITGAKISSIQVFKKDGGEVRHSAPAIPIIGQIIISLSPFVAGFLAIYFIAKVVGLKTIDIEPSLSVLANPLILFWDMLKSIDFNSFRTWLAFYLILSIAVTMTPSAQDLRNVALSIVGIGAIIYILIRYLGIHIHYEWIIRPELLAIIGSSILILIGALFLSIVIAIIAGLFKIN